MAGKLPYVAQPGIVTSILNKIRDAATPDTFTYEYLEKTLGFKGGNYKQFVPLAKKIGLLNADGTPSDLYKKYRNKHSSGYAIANAIKIGYSEIFTRNENANTLSKEQINGLVVEITGLDQKNKVVQLTCQTFEALKQFADFKSPGVEGRENKENPITENNADNQSNDFGMNLSYVINLVLPKTDDPAVFNAIFKSLRDNLLRK
jgi:hypothetical protein